MFRNIYQVRLSVAIVWPVSVKKGFEKRLRQVVFYTQILLPGPTIPKVYDSLSVGCRLPFDLPLISCNGRAAHLALPRGVEKICTNSHKKRKGGGSTASELCEVCVRPSAISADVTHAVGVADLAPATEHAEARLFAPFAVVVAVLAPEARRFAPFGQLNLFL